METDINNFIMQLSDLHYIFIINDNDIIEKNGNIRHCNASQCI
jgi:hypothetical protein